MRGRICSDLLWFLQGFLYLLKGATRKEIIKEDASETASFRKGTREENEGWYNNENFNKNGALKCLWETI